MLELDLGNFESAVELLNKSLVIGINNSTSTKYGILKGLFHLSRERAKDYLDREILSAKDASYS
jgi:hypothetical protein